MKLFRGLIRIIQFCWNTITFIRVFLFNLIILLIVSSVIYGLYKSGWQKEVPKRATLWLQPYGVIVDELSEQSVIREISQNWLEEPTETLLSDLVQIVQKAVNDPRIDSMILDLRQMQHTPLNILNELGQELLHFREQGKRITAISNSYERNAYYLAVHANQIWLHPLEKVKITGFTSYQPYFRELLDKLGVTIHVVRVGKYKSALEPVLRENMSPEDKEMRRAILRTMWDSYVQTIFRLRKIEPEKIRQYTEQYNELILEYAGDHARLALQHGWVDALRTHDEIDKLLQIEKENPSVIHYSDYISFWEQALNQNADKPQIAILIAKGEITEGRQPPGSIGSDTMIELIRELKANPKVKAVVVRIDSPGGSAKASEIIRQELEFLGIEKNVIISMGSLAASGGYWIAMAGEEIWAAPTTLTGSIGVFSVTASAQSGFKELGIQADGVRYPLDSTVENLLLPIEQRSLETTESSVKFIYQMFLNQVVERRKLPIATVEEIAQGRVWSGVDAHRIQLVDQLGGLADAVKSAAQRAGLQEEEYTVFYQRADWSWQQKLLQQWNVWLQEKFDLRIKALSRIENNPLFQQVQQVSHQLQKLLQPGIQAACLDCIVE